MINSGPNVFDAKAQICTRNLELRRRGGWLKPRTRGMNQRCPFSTVEHLDAHQHVSDRRLKTSEFNSLTGQSICSGVDPSPFEERIRQFLLDRLLEVLHVARYG